MFCLCAGVLTFLLSISFAPVVLASYMNFTIDDTTGDARTGSLPSYAQLANSSTWFTNVDCAQGNLGLCPMRLINSSSVLNTTWHATWGPSEMSFKFNGTSEPHFYGSPHSYLQQDLPYMCI